MQTKYRWRSISGRGLEHLTLHARDGGGWHARSVVIADGGFACVYDIQIDAAWHTRRVRVARNGVEPPLVPESHGQGRWTHDGEPLFVLDGTIDPDLSVSAFTNTLPIRRLGLAIGQSADIVTAYVMLPDFEVFADPQRYTRIGEHTYLYESRDSYFRGEIEVDEDGIMLRFDQMFMREN